MYVLKKRTIPGLFLFTFVYLQTVDSKVFNKRSQLLDSDPGPLVSKAHALSTTPEKTRRFPTSYSTATISQRP